MINPYYPVKKSPANILKNKIWALFVFVFFLSNYYLFISLFTIVIPRSCNYNSKLKNKKPRRTIKVRLGLLLEEIILNWVRNQNLSSFRDKIIA